MLYEKIYKDWYLSEAGGALRIDEIFQSCQAICNMCNLTFVPRQVVSDCDAFEDMLICVLTSYWQNNVLCGLYSKETVLAEKMMSIYVSLNKRHKLLFEQQAEYYEFWNDPENAKNVRDTFSNLAAQTTQNY